MTDEELQSADAIPADPKVTAAVAATTAPNTPTPVFANVFG